MAAVSVFTLDLLTDGHSARDLPKQAFFCFASINLADSNSSINGGLKYFERKDATPDQPAWCTIAFSDAPA